MQAHPWVRPGHLFTKGPGTYKIPTANDIPLDFRVTLMQNTPNPRAVHSSKVCWQRQLTAYVWLGVGSRLCLACWCFFQVA